jgi:hypothetical protein
MSADLEADVQREMERLKTVETTLDFIHRSAKKQMTDFLSSGSKSKGREGQK